MDQDRVPGPRLAKVMDKEMRSHSLEQECGPLLKGECPRQLDQPFRVDRRVLAVASQVPGIGDPVSNAEVQDLFTDSLDNTRSLQSGNEWELQRIRPATMVNVHEIHACCADSHEDLPFAGRWLRLRIGEFQHTRIAKA